MADRDFAIASYWANQLTMSFNCGHVFIFFDEFQMKICLSYSFVIRLSKPEFRFLDSFASATYTQITTLSSQPTKCTYVLKVLILLREAILQKIPEFYEILS